MKILAILISTVSLLISATFDPETGLLLESKPDSTKVSTFDPKTGTFNNIQTSSKKRLLNNYQIQSMASQDIDKYLLEEMKTYKYVGGAAALSSILPITIFSQGLAYGISGGELVGIGGLVGLISSIYFVPRLIATIDTKKSILLELEHVKELSNQEQQIYLDYVSKELKRKRIIQIYKGEQLLSLTGIGSLIFLGIIFD